MSTVMIITEAGLEIMIITILIMIMMMIIMISDDNDGGRPSSSDKCAVQLRRGGAPTLNTLLQIIRSFSLIIKIIPNYNDFKDHTSKSRS